jgi:hypothetical protein
MRAHSSAERIRDTARKRDRVPLHGDVDVEVGLPEQDVPNRATDEVDPVEGLAGSRDRFEGRREVLQAGQLAGKARLGLGLGLRTLTECP